MSKPFDRKIRIQDILALVEKVRFLTGKEDSEVSFDYINKNLFPQYELELEKNYKYKCFSSSDDDADCYCE